MVGAKPGPEEERVNQAYAISGVAGEFFHKVYRRFVAQKLLVAGVPVAWAVTNAVRCMPPKDANVTPAQVGACKTYLEADIAALAPHFDEIIVLATGEPATRALFGTGLTAGMRRQGAEVQINGTSARVFSTANPFVLAVDPAQIHYVRDHLQMMVDYLIHGKIPMTWEIPPERDFVEIIPGSPVSIDTETYGAVAGFPLQTNFHPVKMVACDGMVRNRIVTTAAAAWLSPDGVGLRKWVLPDEEPAFYEFVRWILTQGHPLLSINLPFDIKVMRTLGPRWEKLLAAENRWPLRDVSVANFWDSDIRPERSIKDLAPLLRVFKYPDKTSLKGGFRYPSRYSKELLEYCGIDAGVALEIFIRLRDRTLANYPGTRRFSERSLAWYSDVLWTVVNMDTAGVVFNRSKLEAMEKELTAEMDTLFQLVPLEYEGTIFLKKLKRKAGTVIKEVPRPAALGGQGSEAWINKVFTEAVFAAGLNDHPYLKKTKESQYTVPATHKDNMNLILGHLPVGHVARRPLEIIRQYRRAEKLLGTYVTPLLHEPVRGLIGNMAYPTWFSVPSFAKDGEGESGGTQQGRFAAKDPALQTMPKKIKACLDTRFDDGVLLEFDINQAEPRLGALLSGDPIMIAEFEEDARMRAAGLGKLDFHTITARAVFGEDVESHPDFSDKRHVAKIVRLLTAYKGGPSTLQESLRRGESPIEFPMEQCRAMIAAFDRKYKVYRAWQDRLIADVTQKGYMELVISADTRTFVKGKKASEVYVATICNFPVQDHASSVLKSAQTEVQLEFWRRRMRAVVVLNVHDAIYVDCPASEEAEVKSIVADILPCPPYYSELQSIVGRTVPLQYTVSVIARRNAA